MKSFEMIKYYLGFILMLFSLIACGQEMDERLMGLEEEINRLMEVHQTVGLSLAVVENNEVLCLEGFGYRDYQQQLPVTPNTLFAIGSVTKPVTATLIGVYQGKEKLSVNDRPSKFIPFLQFHTDEMNQIITIEDLLAHRSGIGNVDGTHVFFPTGNTTSHLKRLKFLKPNSQVRARLDYSNMGYAILGGITEAITGRTWAENVKAEIFSPLEMHQSNCSITELENSKNYALGYSIANDSVLKVEYEDQNESVASGAINSSANDLSKWVSMLLNQGIYKDQQIVPKKYIESAFSEHNIIRGSFSFDKKYHLLFDTYGYGWFVHQYKGLYRVTHGGNVSGFTANVCLLPHKNIGIVLLSNQGSANQLLHAITDIIVNRLLKLERKNWEEYAIQIGQGRVPVQNLKPINKDQSPSLELSAYCGSYQSPGYGMATVSLESGQLFIEFPAFKMGLEHQQQDVFVNRIISTVHQNTPSFPISFFLNDQGKISGLTIGFSNPPEPFKKIE